ncbi:MAG: SPOR domain-containing protein [Halocynthiibacter sp.]
MTEIDGRMMSNYGASHHAQAQTGMTSSMDKQKLTAYAGAGAALLLTAAIVVWGVKLVSRDVSGVPVVQALEGPMRVQPDNPGGDVMRHQGLAVNEIQSNGAAAPVPEQVMLAPETVDVIDGDAPTRLGDIRPVKRPETVTANAAPQITDPSDAKTDAEVVQAPDALGENDLLALVDSLTQGATKLEAVAPSRAGSEIAPIPVSVPAEPLVETETAGSAPGQSLRPRRRPTGIKVASLNTDAAVLAALSSIDVAPESVAKGTRLVQLGAFASAEIAQKEWTRISGKYNAYFDSKKRVIQKASTNGGVFYRLRVLGFSDRAAAERFCTELSSSGQACIPVVAR